MTNKNKNMTLNIRKITHVYTVDNNQLYGFEV